MISLISPKEKAISLRRKGKSYGEINSILGIPKSTLSTWLKDLPISKEVKENNINKAKFVWSRNITQFNKIRSEKYKIKEAEIISDYAKEIPKFSKDALFWTGLSLFWAEGGKKEKWSIHFVNSDPVIIKTMMLFFKKFCTENDKDFVFRIHLYPNIDDDKAKLFWSKTVGINNAKFYKSQMGKSGINLGKRKINQLPYGTLHIYINNSLLVKKIKGWLKGLSEIINNMPG